MLSCTCSFGQKLDSNILINEDINKYNFEDYGVNLQISKKYKKTSPNRPSFHRSNIMICMPRNFYDPIINKKNKEHYIFYFFLNYIFPPIEEGSIMKRIAPNWTPNKNYLGSKICEEERNINLMQIYTKSDFKKFNADTALCIRLDSNAIFKTNEKFNDIIYVIIHKDNIADIYVCIAYKKEYEFEVIQEIKKLWKIVKFKQ